MSDSQLSFEQSLQDLLKGLYTKKEIARLAEDIEPVLEDAKKELRLADKNNPSSRDLLWYKNTILYVIYPDAIRQPKKNSFESLTEHLDYIKDLGCNSVHVLPFLKSPMVDKGFDISDYIEIREDLGTLVDVKGFIQRANELRIKVFMDLVLNHVSIEHDWFKKAEEGDEKYIKYFFTTKKEPKFLRMEHKNADVWAVYEEKGKEVEATVAFPETVAELPHWRKSKNGDLWYYYTYYPEQPDVNWFNPDVFFEFTKIMIFWLKMGFNFRLDAIPFVGKKPYKDAGKDHEFTNKIVAALNFVSNEVKQEVALLAESYQSLQNIIDYFGSSNKEQVQLAYNFHLCTKLWISLITEDTKYVWDQLEETQHIPFHAGWINFLRNHDELSLAHLPDELVKKANQDLGPNGANFRGEFGISGRTFSLVGGDRARFLMFYFLLISIPGSILIPYGDELGVENVPAEDLSEMERRDTRNINRGRLTKKQIQSEKGETSYKDFQKLLEYKENINKYANIWPEKLNYKNDNKNVFAAKYVLGSSQLIILINMSESAQIIEQDFDGFEAVAQVNKASLEGSKKVKLGRYAGLWLQK